MREIQPLEPMDQNGQTPVPGVPAGLPAWPLTPLSVWTWATPVIPTFYWNVYSSEQRVKQICLEIGRIEAYLDRLVTDVNKNIIYLEQYIKEVEERVAALEKRLEEEVARLDALIAQLREDLEQEIRDREAADNQLHEEISDEVADRIHGDDVLHQEISDETTARVHADDEITARLSREEATRAERDNYLQDLINSNTVLINGNAERIDAAEASLRRKLEQDDIAGADRIVVTPGEGNRVTISSTFDADFEAVEDAIATLQGALAQETQERQEDVRGLWDAVHRRIERGKILAGSGIKVENDPDQSTVTISATGGGTGGSTEITGTAPITVTDGEEGEKIVGVSAATEDSAGVITEARVKELAAGESKTYTAGPGIKISDADTISIAVAPSNASVSYVASSRTLSANLVDNLGRPAERVLVGPGNPEQSRKGRGLFFSTDVPSQSGTNLGLGVAAGQGLQIASSGELDVKTSTETDPGIITEARVKELAGSVAPSLSAEEPLTIEDGEISLTKDPAGPVTSSSAGLSVREITPETESEEETGVVSKATIKSLAQYSGGVNEDYGLTNAFTGGMRVKASKDVFGFTGSGELALSSRHVVSGENTTNLPAVYVFDRSGRPAFVTDLSMDGAMAYVKKFWLVTAKFQVKTSSSSEWETAQAGTFEAFVLAGSASGTLYMRCTPYGSTYYAGPESNANSWSIAGVKIIYSVLGLPIEA